MTLDLYMVLQHYCREERVMTVEERTETLQDRWEHRCQTDTVGGTVLVMFARVSSTHKLTILSTLHTPHCQV